LQQGHLVLVRRGIARKKERGAHAERVQTIPSSSVKVISLEQGVKVGQKVTYVVDKNC
jgi:hypothetical protein